MKRVLAAFAAVILCACAVAAQGTPSGSEPPPPPLSPELAEAARLTVEVVKLYGQQKYDEALPLARRVVEIRERVLGGEHMMVANALNNLGAVLMQKDKDGEAARTLERALAIMEKNNAGATEGAADIDNRLGLLGLESKKYKEAAAYFQRALDIKEKARGAGSPALVPQLLNLTDAFFLMDQRDKAHDFLVRAAEIVNAQPPKDDPATARKLESYICLLKMEGEEDLLGKVDNAISRLQNVERQNVRFEKLVPGGVLNGRVLKKPPPDYPTAAKNARVSGTVIVRITVDEEGKVIKAEPICGHSLLRKAAADAASAARFSPTLLAGRPVKVTGVITYNFIIQ